MSASDVRQLTGEDLDRWDWADLPERARALGEVQALAPCVDELDYLAAWRGGRVLGVGAIGYRTPFGGASVCALSVDPAVESGAGALVAHLEERARSRTCTSVEVRVAADAPAVRTAVETLGYGLVGATTVSPGPPGRPGVTPGHVDSWVLRKDLHSGADPVHQPPSDGA